MRLRSPDVKRVAVAALLICLCALSGSCAVREEKLTVEIIAAGTASAFWTSAYAGAQAAAEQYNANIKLFGPPLEKDYSQLAHILRQSVGRMPDAIVVGAADDSLATALSALAAEISIPFVAIDACTGDDSTASCVGSNHYALGEAMAREIQSRLSGGIVAVISDIKTSATANDRAAGFIDTLAESPAFSVLEPVYCDADVDTAKQQTSALLADHKALTAVVCLSAQATVGAGRAIEETNAADIFLAGIDCPAEAAWLMERGILDITVLQNPYAMGYYSVETAIKRLRGEPAEQLIHTDFRMITKETMFTAENQRLIFPIP